MKRGKQDKVFIQVQATRGEREKLIEIAEHRGHSMARVIRDYIHAAHSQVRAQEK